MMKRLFTERHGEGKARVTRPVLRPPIIPCDPTRSPDESTQTPTANEDGPSPH